LSAKENSFSHPAVFRDLLRVAKNRVGTCRAGQLIVIMGLLIHVRLTRELILRQAPENACMIKKIILSPGVLMIMIECKLSGSLFYCNIAVHNERYEVLI